MQILILVQDLTDDLTEDRPGWTDRGPTELDRLTGADRSSLNLTQYNK